MPYKNLKAEMARREVTIKELSELLDIHRNSVANKLDGDSAFTIEEAMKIHTQYFADLTLEYLFERE